MHPLFRRTVGPLLIIAGILVVVLASSAFATTPAAAFLGLNQDTAPQDDPLNTMPANESAAIETYNDVLLAGQLGPTTADAEGSTLTGQFITTLIKAMSGWEIMIFGSAVGFITTAAGFVVIVTETRY